jgi:Tfp pilus assembly protein PilO
VAAKETGEKQIFGITIGIFALVLVVVGLLVFLSARKLNEHNNNAEKYEAERKKAAEIAEQEKAVLQKKRDTEARAKECSQYLPKDDDVERTLLSLNDKCNEANLSSTTLKLDSSATQGRPGQVRAAHETIRYKGEFEGSFHQIAKFVSAVENWKTFNRFLSIAAFSMEADERGMTFDDGHQKHKVKMTLELYKYREPVAAASGPAKGTPPAKPTAAPK